MEENKDLRKVLKRLVTVWDKIPDQYKENIRHQDSNIPGLKKEGHIVVLLLDRQKPSVEASYDFDMERLGINKDGEIIWGFDSGCSCPSPWNDSYPGCYTATRTWKEFVLDNVNTKEIEKEDTWNRSFFDEGFQEEALKLAEEILKKSVTRLQELVMENQNNHEAEE